MQRLHRILDKYLIRPLERRLAHFLAQLLSDLLPWNFVASQQAAAKTKISLPASSLSNINIKTAA